MTHLRYDLSGLCLGLALFLCGSLAFAAGDTVTFTFAPNDKITFNDQSTQTTTFLVDGKKHVEIIKSKSKYKIAKTGENYCVDETLDEMSCTRDGEAVDHPLSLLLKGITLSTVLNAKCDVLDIRGDDKLRERAREQVPEDMEGADENIDELFGHKKLLELVKQDWDDDTGRFIGRTVKIGDLWIDTGDEYLPGDVGEEAPVYRATLISGWKDVNGRDLLRVKIIYHTSAAGLAKEIGKTEGDVKKAVKKPLPAPKKNEMLIVEEVILDPASMLLYSETKTSQATVSMEMPGGKSKKISITEKTECQFIYR